MWPRTFHSRCLKASTLPEMTCVLNMNCIKTAGSYNIINISYLLFVPDCKSACREACGIEILTKWKLKQKKNDEGVIKAHLECDMNSAVEARPVSTWHTVERSVSYKCMFCLLTLIFHRQRCQGFI